MDDDDTLFRLLSALGIRPVRIADLPRNVLFIQRHEIMLVDADLTPADRGAALDRALHHWLDC